MGGERSLVARCVHSEESVKPIHRVTVHRQVFISQEGGSNFSFLSNFPFVVPPRKYRTIKLLDVLVFGSSCFFVFVKCRWTKRTVVYRTHLVVAQGGVLVAEGAQGSTPYLHSTQAAAGKACVIHHHLVAGVP